MKPVADAKGILYTPRGALVGALKPQTVPPGIDGQSCPSTQNSSELLYLFSSCLPNNPARLPINATEMLWFQTCTAPIDLLFFFGCSHALLAWLPVVEGGDVAGGATGWVPPWVGNRSELSGQAPRQQIEQIRTVLCTGA